MGAGGGGSEGGGARRARLLWRCRRGMLETDLLLEERVAPALEDLDEGELVALEGLLALPDPQLLELLLGRHRPRDPGQARLLVRLGLGGPGREGGREGGA